MDELPVELLQLILEYCDSIRSFNSLKQTSQTLNTNVTQIVQHKTKNQPNSFRIYQMVDNIRSLPFSNRADTWLMRKKIDLSSGIFIILEWSFLQKKICIIHPFDNSKWHELHTTSLFLTEVVHYIPAYYQLVLHSHSFHGVNQKSFYTETIVHLWPEIKTSVRDVEQKLFYGSTPPLYPFCPQCYSAYPELSHLELPLSNKYKIIKKTKEDVIFAHWETTNVRKIKIFSHKLQSRTILAQSVPHWKNTIRITHFFDNFALIGLWHRANKRHYELYHIISPTQFKKYKVVYNRGGLGACKKIISLNLLTNELVFESKKKVKYVTRLFSIEQS